MKHRGYPKENQSFSALPLGLTRARHQGRGLPKFSPRDQRDRVGEVLWVWSVGEVVCVGFLRDGSGNLARGAHRETLTPHAEMSPTALRGMVRGGKRTPERKKPPKAGRRSERPSWGGRGRKFKSCHSDQKGDSQESPFFFVFRPKSPIFSYFAA